MIVKVPWALFQDSLQIKVMKELESKKVWLNLLDVYPMDRTPEGFNFSHHHVCSDGSVCEKTANKTEVWINNLSGVSVMLQF